jgi:hypothetical protein
MVLPVSLDVNTEEVKQPSASVNPDNQALSKFNLGLISKYLIFVL